MGKVLIALVPIAALLALAYGINVLMTRSYRSTIRDRNSTINDLRAENTELKRDESEQLRLLRNRVEAYEQMTDMVVRQLDMGVPEFDTRPLSQLIKDLIIETRPRRRSS